MSFNSSSASAAIAAASSSIASPSPSPSPMAPSLTSATSAASMAASSALPPTVQHEIVTQAGVNSATNAAELNVVQTMDAVHFGGPAAVVGNNLLFVPGYYDPYSDAGRNLLFQSVNTATNPATLSAFDFGSAVPTTQGDEAGTVGGGGVRSAVAGAAAGLFRR